MRGRAGWLLAALGLVVAGCADNTAPGNDREAALDPARPPAEVVAAEAAIAGVATSLLKPEVMTEADVSNVPAGAAGCRFRMTRVDFPSFVFSPDGGRGMLKLNGKLAALGEAGPSSFAADGVRVEIRPLGEDEGADLQPAELVLLLPDARHELGFRGFLECGPA